MLNLCHQTITGVIEPELEVPQLMKSIFRCFSGRSAAILSVVIKTSRGNHCVTMQGRGATFH